MPWKIISNFVASSTWFDEVFSSPIYRATLDLGRVCVM